MSPKRKNINHPRYNMTKIRSLYIRLDEFNTNVGSERKPFDLSIFFHKLISIS